MYSRKVGQRTKIPRRKRLISSQQVAKRPGRNPLTNPHQNFEVSDRERPRHVVVVIARRFFTALLFSLD